MSGRVIACIAARDEGGNIYALVRELRARGLDVLVINDGSADSTGELAKAAGATVYGLRPSMGIAESYLTAWSIALTKGATAIVQIDAGGSHLPGDARGLLDTLGGADVVVGTRFATAGCYVGGWRQWLSRLATLACNLRYGFYLTDWTSGYRAFTADAARRLLSHGYRAKMHGWQIEVLIRALQDGLRVTEVPISYLGGRSSFNWRVAWEAFDVWVRG